jgi:hypothetical protein
MRQWWAAPHHHRIGPANGARRGSGGEVVHALSMVDGVLLLVDASASKAHVN